MSYVGTTYTVHIDVCVPLLAITTAARYPLSAVTKVVKMFEAGFETASLVTGIRKHSPFSTQRLLVLLKPESLYCNVSNPLEHLLDERMLHLTLNK